MEQHVYLVRYTMRVCPSHSSLEAEDIEARGHLALCVAAAMWRPEGGASFKTYAITQIRWALADMIRKAPGGTRCLQKSPNVSLSTPVGDTSAAWRSGMTLADVLPGDGEEDVIDEMLANLVQEAIQKLPERERRVLLARLDGETFRQISEGLGVTFARVRQIEQTAIRRLQKALESYGAIATGPARGCNRPHLPP